MESTFGSRSPQNGQMGGGPDGSPVGSDRLRKAIERNRAKQARKKGSSSSTSFGEGGPAGPPPQESNNHEMEAPPSQGAFQQVPPPGPPPEAFNDAPPAWHQDEPPKKKVVRKKVRRKIPSSPAAKAAPAPNYNSTGWEKFKKWPIKLGWVLSLVLLFRLAFSDRGAMDYYSHLDLLNEKEEGLRALKEENISIGKEIELIRLDPQYQKKLVRDHLGYISKNEYLVLFPKDRKRN